MIRKYPRLIAYTLISLFGVGGFYLITQAATVYSPSASATNNSVTITWATDTATDSCVQMGTTSANLYNTGCTDSAGVTTHTRTFNSLSPGTTYYYSVG